jgi:hypothetical protein
MVASAQRKSPHVLTAIEQMPRPLQFCFTRVVCVESHAAEPHDVVTGAYELQLPWSSHIPSGPHGMLA